jgi:predicted metal-dependent HD superfamily phosphohydrolase
MIVLETAALLHDFYVVLGQDGKNEIKSGRFARKYLYKLGFSDIICEGVARLILATTMPQRPKDNLEGLMCDADLSSLGSSDYLVWQDRLRREWSKSEDKAWYELQLRFLSGHKYHTPSAVRLLGEQKEKNLRAMEAKLGSYE